MSSQYDFDPVGLGISFQQAPPLQYAPVHRPTVGHLQNDYSGNLAKFHQRTGNPDAMLRSFHSSNYTEPPRHAHQRTQSAVVPQRATFERSHSSGHHIQAPRSAHPVQRPFVSPVLTSRDNTSYTHSAPVTPTDQDGPASFYFTSRESLREPPRSETVYDRRQQRRQRLEARPPPFYNPSSRYMDSPIQEDVSGLESSSTSSKSYFHMTPQIQNTPFSDAGQFPVPENYLNHSNYHTPQFGSSPVFDGYREGFYEDRRGRFDERDEMPEEPYVPTTLTSFPPLRPSALRRNTTDESRLAFDSEDPNSIFTSPASSAPGTPQPKDRKVAYSRWSSSEDLLLKEAIAKHGDGKWSLVSQMVPGRTPMQCSTRWQGALNTSIHKGRWDPEEDAILIKSVAEWQAWHMNDNKDLAGDALNEELYKNIPWSNIAQLLPRPRTGVQALARWSEALDPRITKGKWTATEDAALLRGVSKYGKCWIKIANGVKGRTQRQCRTRYCQISDKKRKVRGGPLTRSPDLGFSE